MTTSTATSSCRCGSENLAWVSNWSDAPPLFFLFIGGLSAHAAFVLPFTPEILDVQGVPPLEPNTAQRSTHPWRSNSRIAANPAASCQAPTVQLLPESGADHLL